MSRPSGASDAGAARRERGAAAARWPPSRGGDLDRLAEAWSVGPARTYGLADPAAVEGGDDPRGEVVDVDQPDADVVERPGTAGARVR